MQLLSLLVTALAATSAVSAVKLSCKHHGVEPFCCENLAKVALTNVTVGIHCKLGKKGGKTHCHKKATKVCCTGAPTTVADLVEICQLPLHLKKILSKVPGIGNLPAPILPHGGLGGL